MIVMIASITVTIPTVRITTDHTGVPYGFQGRTERIEFCRIGHIVRNDIRNWRLLLLLLLLLYIRFSLRQWFIIHDDRHIIGSIVRRIMVGVVHVDHRIVIIIVQIIVIVVILCIPR